MQNTVTIILPVLNEEKNINVFLEKVSKVLPKNHEILFCLDPSSDRSEEILKKAYYQDPRIKFITFSRRVGQPMATLAGLGMSSGDAVIVMDVALKKELGVGDFLVELPVKDRNAKKIELSFSCFQALPKGDGRPVGGKTNFIGFNK